LRLSSPKDASNLRKFQHTRPKDPNADGAIFDIDASLTATIMEGTWKSTYLSGEPEQRPEVIEFSGQITGTSKSHERASSLATVLRQNGGRG